jgi:TonB family protein
MRMLQSALESGFGAGLETTVLNYLLNSLWQIPLVFCAAFAAARLARQAGPGAEHRVWVGALLLEIALPACHFRLSEFGQQTWGLVLWFLHGNAAGGETRVILGAGTAPGVRLPAHTVETLALVASAYLCAVLYSAGRLAWGAWTTERMRRLAVRFELEGDAAARLNRLQRMVLAGGREVRLAVSARIAGPATVGLRRQTLLLPPGFVEMLSADELDAVLAHELAHMARRDFLKNLLYGFAALPAAYHPLLWMTRARLAETRELVCDAMAADAAGGRENYARSLLRLARMLTDRRAPRILHAIGIFDANIFERRVMHLTAKHFELKGARRLAIGAGCAILAFTACTSALALRMDVQAPSPSNPAPKSIHVKETAMNVVSKVQPVYPVTAKKDKISGSVVLAATIGKDGTVEHLKVTKSLRADCDKSAIDAVHEWRYKPFLLNGNPIEVETTITVNYTLAQ